MENINKHGGKRPNSGRKKSEQTKPLYCRIPVSIYSEILEYVQNAVKYHKSESTKR